MSWYINNTVPIGGYVTAYSYIVVTPPVNLPVSLDTVREFTKATSATSDDILTMLILAAADFAERYTSRTLISTGFKTYRDYFTYCIQLRRSPLQSVTSIKYIKDGSLVLIDPSIYYNTIETDYSSIYLNDGKSWPDDVDYRVQSIEIEFIAGYGDNESDIPYDLRLALLNHILDMHENRGDCDDCSSCLPKQSKLIYDKYKIYSFPNNNVCRSAGC